MSSKSTPFPLTGLLRISGSIVCARPVMDSRTVSRSAFHAKMGSFLVCTTACMFLNTKYALALTGQTTVSILLYAVVIPINYVYLGLSAMPLMSCIP